MNKCHSCEYLEIEGHGVNCPYVEHLVPLTTEEFAAFLFSIAACEGEEGNAFLTVAYCFDASQDVQDFMYDIYYRGERWVTSDDSYEEFCARCEAKLRS